MSIGKTIRTGGIFDKIKGIIGKSPNVSEASEKPLLFPSVTGFAAWRLPITPDLDQRQLIQILCERYDINRPLALRFLRKGLINVMRYAGDPGLGSQSPQSMASPSSPPLSPDTKRLVPRENMKMKVGDIVYSSELPLKARQAGDSSSPITHVGDGKPLSPAQIETIQKMVMYRDDRIILFNKPSGISMHAGPGTAEHLLHWLPALRFDSPCDPLIVHRLDKGTSGALILARTKEAAAHLAKTIRESGLDETGLEKVYWALVKGKPDRRHRSGNIITNIYQRLHRRDKRGVVHEMMTSFADRRSQLLDAGKVAISRYRYMQEHLKRASSATRSAKEVLSLMEVIPETGRTHQIRVHLAEQLKLPVYGDYRYNPNQPPGRKLHLHCYRITLKRWLPDGKDLVVKAPIPDHFVNSMSSHPIKLNAPPPRK